ncbi:hypothetical protein B0H14DRAFT_3854033 [Mycena olivaceomarginata]|nr:hypothetical protein B0H14DRAFT_3854033 [Mycena olivaceomarginata]
MLSAPRRLSPWLLPPSSNAFPIATGILTTILQDNFHRLVHGLECCSITAAGRCFHYLVPSSAVPDAQQTPLQNRGHQRACVDDAPRLHLVHWIRAVVVGLAQLWHPVSMLIRGHLKQQEEYHSALATISSHPTPRTTATFLLRRLLCAVRPGRAAAQPTPCVVTISSTGYRLQHQNTVSDALCDAGAPCPQTPPPCTVNHDAHPQRHTQRTVASVPSSHVASVAYLRSPTVLAHTPSTLRCRSPYASPNARLTAHVCCVALGLHDTIPLRSITRMRAFVLAHSRHNPVAPHHPYAQHAHRPLSIPGAASLALPLVSTIVTAFTPARLTAAPIAHQCPLPHFDPGLFIIACAALVPHCTGRENAVVGGQHVRRAECLRARRKHKRSTCSSTASAPPPTMPCIERFCTSGNSDYI